MQKQTSSKGNHTLLRYAWKGFPLERIKEATYPLSLPFSRRYVHRGDSHLLWKLVIHHLSPCTVCVTAIIVFLEIVKRARVYNRCLANLLPQSRSLPRGERKPLPRRRYLARRNVYLPVMWTALMLLCLLASFDVNAAGRSPQGQSSPERSASTVASLRTIASRPDRLPRRFRGNSPTRRLHIENQHGFDGKVEKILINSEEDLPGVRAYGLQKKDQVNNGHIEKIREEDDAARNPRSIEVYGKNKDHLDMNGYIERVQPSISSQRLQATRDARPRGTRSIETESKHENGLEDLEAQDAKVFRPLFVYRQQVAKRQHRARNHIHGHQAGQKPCDHWRPIF